MQLVLIPLLRVLDSITPRNGVSLSVVFGVLVFNALGLGLSALTVPPQGRTPAHRPCVIGYWRCHTSVYAGCHLAVAFGKKDGVLLRVMNPAINKPGSAVKVTGVSHLYRLTIQ